jgi:murein DD-endopeptidase MepM/ murein hydrolase activator NlpD
MKKKWENFAGEIRAWGRGWSLYIQKRLRRFGSRFEANKSVLVDILMARRGTYQRPFLHFSLGLLFVVGAMSAPILARTSDNNVSNFTPPSAVSSSLNLSQYGIQTQVSEKPRDQVVTYAVAKGDTLSTIAEKFGVSVDTIKWANDIRRDTLTIGQEVKIPPVTGVVHKVREGETVFSISKKYKTDAQKIVNFPFNDFADLDTFSLVSGQTLVVPDGVIAEAPPVRQAAPSVIAGGTGQFIWPTNGVISQYPVWYHMALDIANPSAPGIAAADNGTVIQVEYLRYGYGQHVIMGHGNGVTSLYGHMSEIYVKVGDDLKRGQILGRMGSTGRSTGTHLHFEIRRNGITQNPLNFLK